VTFTQPALDDTVDRSHQTTSKRHLRTSQLNICTVFTSFTKNYTILLSLSEVRSKFVLTYRK